jgi:TctA family transporter
MLFPIILIFACVGVFSLNHDPMDLVVLAAMAWIGYIFYRLDLEPAPLLLGFILGPIMEENLRRSLLLSGGDASIFFVKPISCLFLGCSALLLLLPLILPSLRRMVRTSAGETTG